MDCGWHDCKMKEKKEGGAMQKIETLKRWIAESTNIVFFGGAGVSTEHVT